MQNNFNNPSSKLGHLKFDLDYHRKKQVERLVAHVEEGNSIASFTYHHAEYSLDSVLFNLGEYLDEIAETQAAANDKKFWHRFKK